MVKNLVKTMVLAGLLATVSAPLTAAAEGKADPPAFQIKLSGATGVVQPEPKDGILSGGYCLPDIHIFDKAEIVQTPWGSVPNHIVFAVHVEPQANNKATVSNFNLNDVKVNVMIYGSGNDLVATVPLEIHPGIDPNTGTEFFVQCIFLNGPYQTNLPTGEYSYKFEATVKNPKGDNPSEHVRQWVPSNNTFTIVDSSL
jgi:hypothetical protein